MPRRLVLGVLVAVASCGDGSRGPDEPEPLPTPAWDAVCGREAPQLVLPLALGEHAYRIDRIADDERWLVSTFLVDPSVPLASGPPTLDRVIRAVGPCGEDAVEVARGLRPGGRHGALTLACGGDGHGTWAIDPSGVEPPRQLLGGWCPPRSTDHGLLTVDAPSDATHGALVLLRDPADPTATPQVLAEGIRVPRNTYYGPGGNGSTSLWAAGDQALVLDEAGTVWHVELGSGERVEELTGVRELRVSSDARLAIWQALEPSEGDSRTPVGPVFLRDREAGTDAYLLGTHLEWTGTPWAGDYLLVRDDADGVRLWWRDGLEPIERPAGTELRGVLEGGELWLARRADGQTEELRWHPAQGGEPFVFARHDGVVSRYGDGIEIYETDEALPPTEGRLSFVPFTGGEPELLADRVDQVHGRVADGRIMTVVDADPSEHGPLRLIDPEAGTIVGLDLRGYLQSPRLNAGDPFDGDLVLATAGGERPPGVYRARVPR